MMQAYSILQSNQTVAINITNLRSQGSYNAKFCVLIGKP